MDAKTETALALLLLVTVGSAAGSVAWFVRALMLRWLKKHHIVPETEKPDA